MVDGNEIEKELILSNPERLKWMEDKLLGGILNADPTEADWAALRSETRGVELLAEGDFDGSMMLDLLQILDSAQRVRPESMHEDSASYFKCLQEAQWYAAGRANGSERFMYIRDDLEQHIANELVFFAFAATDKEAKRYAINKGLFMGSDFHNINGDKGKKVETFKNPSEDLRSIVGGVMQYMDLDPDNLEAFRVNEPDETMVDPKDPDSHMKLSLIIGLAKAFYSRPQSVSESPKAYLKQLEDLLIFAGAIQDTADAEEDKDMAYYIEGDLQNLIYEELELFNYKPEEDELRYALRKDEKKK